MNQLITIKTFTYPHEAYIIRGKLDSEGIETFLKDEMTVQVNNFYSNAVGGVKLQVLEQDVERALEIIGESEKIDDKITVIDETQFENDTQCPFCHSENIMEKKSPNWLTLLPYLVVGFIFPVYRKTHKCFDCEKEWVVRKKRIKNEA